MKRRNLCNMWGINVDLKHAFENIFSIKVPSRDGGYV